MKEIESAVPDSIHAHLNEIADRLWAGRAAVMVGSGFSRNADPNYPLWHNLSSAFQEKIYGKSQDTNGERETDPLLLAEELEAVIGRPALDNLLKTEIPDLTVDPSKLHVDLLSLPWADVFTTNYDTLLERASEKVINRRYEPVLNKEDIPYSEKPRIVKLHGSFPSTRPFVITKEDYVSYPRESAIFVNTVQQAMLENTFCLIGFSGDDPNFQSWIDWIESCLGKGKTQKIYLVGLLNLSTDEKEILSRKGILAVDLNLLQGVGSDDHKKAIEKFIEHIQTRERNSFAWPTKANSLSPKYSEDQGEETQRIVVEWKRQRLSYPGWLILPYSNRGNLWIFTQGWTSFPDRFEEQVVSDDIQYLFELIWRLDRCLLPVFDSIALQCDTVLKKYWPFLTIASGCAAAFDIKDQIHQNLDWIGIREAWLEISIAVLRYYREEGRIDDWNNTKNSLQKVHSYLSSDQKERLSYEIYLFHVFLYGLFKCD